MDSVWRIYSNSGESPYDSTFAINDSLLCLVTGGNVYHSIHFINKATETYLTHCAKAEDKTQVVCMTDLPLGHHQNTFIANVPDLYA